MTVKGIYAMWITTVLLGLGALALLRALLVLRSQIGDLRKKAARADQQAEAARRLKSEFIAKVSHELKTPLNSIVGYVDLVRERKYGAITGEQEDVLRRVHDAADRLLAIIKSLLDFSGADLGKIEARLSEFDLNQELRATLELVEKLAESKGVKVIAEFDSAVGRIYSDRQKIHQALANVLSNAEKFTKKGTITLKSKALREENLILIEVKDTGIGIPEKELPYVFEEFRQADGSIRRDYGGTGLGLSIAQKFIHFLGGEIKVTSRLGEGTAVHIAIPTSISHPMRREAERAPAARALERIS